MEVAIGRVAQLASPSPYVPQHCHKLEVEFHITSGRASVATSLSVNGHHSELLARTVHLQTRTEIFICVTAEAADVVAASAIECFVHMAKPLGKTRSALSVVALGYLCPQTDTIHITLGKQCGLIIARISLHAWCNTISLCVQRFCHLHGIPTSTKE